MLTLEREPITGSRIRRSEMIKIKPDNPPTMSMNPVKYTVVAQVGNCVYTDSLRVSFNDSIYINIGTDTSLCIGEQYALQVKTNANTFEWQDGSTASA